MGQIGRLAFAGEPVCVFVFQFVVVCCFRLHLRLRLRRKKSIPEREFFRFEIKKKVPYLLYLTCM